MGLTELLLVVAIGGGIIAVLYPTLRGAAQEARAEADHAARSRSVSDLRERLELDLDERRRAVLRSLEEIDADREAGNLSEADYKALRRRYEREAALVLAQLDAAEPAARTERSAEAGVPTPARWRVPGAVSWVAGIAAFAALSVVVLTSSLRPRAEGDTITGTIPGVGGPGGPGGPGEPGEPGNAGSLVPIDVERMAALEEIIAADSSDVESLVELGHLYLASQRFREVAQLSMKALSLDPHTPGALAHLGMVLVAADHSDEALTSFDRALEIDPHFAEALLYRGIVSFRAGDFEGAVESWERYLAVAPQDADLSRVRAMLQGARQAARVPGEP